MQVVLRTGRNGDTQAPIQRGYFFRGEATGAAVFCGCETWSLTLSEERRLRVFENRVLRGIFGAKRDEVTGE